MTRCEKKNDPGFELLTTSSSSSSSNDSVSSDGDGDSSSSEDSVPNPYHRVFKSVDELKKAGEFKPGQGQLLDGIVKEGKRLLFVVILEEHDHSDFRFHCEPCNTLLKTNSMNAHKHKKMCRAK